MTPHDEYEFVQRLLREGAASLVEEHDVACDPRTFPAIREHRLLSTWFAIYYSSNKQRLINDRRRINATEMRLHRVVWPMGAQLGQLVVKPCEAVRGSLIDLVSYYWQLKNEQAVHRNCVGRRWPGHLLSEFGARRDRHYFIGMRVLTMGNQNACEIAHQTHAGVLRAGGNLAPGRLIQHRKPLPHSKLIEGLIIDDY